jgi:hypothetical protein
LRQVCMIIITFSFFFMFDFPCIIS